MFSTPSMLSLLAAGFYALVIAASLAAAAISKGSRQNSWHYRVWVAAAILFIALALMRGLGMEEFIRDEFRAVMRSDGTYNERRDFQRPLAAVAIILASAASFFAAYRLSKVSRTRRNLAVVTAVSGIAAMTILLVLRFISLHPIDAVLYGSLRLNWVVDLGASLAVLVGAVYYFLRVRRRS